MISTLPFDKILMHLWNLDEVKLSETLIQINSKYIPTGWSSHWTLKYEKPLRVTEI